MVQLHRIETEGLAQVSFVVAADNGDAIVVDPRRDVALFLDLAQAHDLTLRYVVDTHLHADYASGAPELAQRSGTRLLLRGVTNTSSATPDPDDPLLPHGGTLGLGNLRITALHTPGHTPEHRCFLIDDTSDPAAPAILLSGDTLFVGSVGRPDLLGSDETQQLAAAMHHTLQTVLKPLADETLVYPGHGAGSACGSSIGGAPSSSIGQERISNPYFQFGADDCEAFVARLLSDLPPVPTYFPLMKRLNAAGAPPCPSELPPALAPADLRDRQHDGSTTLLDVRDAATFAEGFLAGALNIGVGGSLATWAGWTLPYDRPVTLLTQHHDEVREAQLWLARVGFDAVSGYAIIADRDTLDAWAAEGVAVQQFAPLTPDEAQTQQANGETQILDVRTTDEWDEAHIAGSTNLPLQQMAEDLAATSGDDQNAALRAALPDSIDPQVPIAVICASGYRSSLAASILRQHGIATIGSVTGGIDAWRQADLPVAGSEAASDSGPA